MIKFDVSAKSALNEFVFRIAGPDLTLIFAGCTFVGFFVAGGGGLMSDLPVFCFCICLHFARLFLNQTFVNEKSEIFEHSITENHVNFDGNLSFYSSFAFSVRSQKDKNKKNEREPFGCIHIRSREL